MRKRKVVIKVEGADWKPLRVGAGNGAFGLITCGGVGERTLIWTGFTTQPFYISTYNIYTPEKLYFKCANDT